MSEAAADEVAAPGVPEAEQPVLRRRWRIVALAGGLSLIALSGLWLARERIADNLIGSQLHQRGIPATYHIEAIGPLRQVLSRVVVGDPRHPDMTVDRIEVDLAPRFGFPQVQRITLVRPQIEATWTGDRVSLGTLDKILFGGGRNQPFRLPDYTLSVVDGGGRVRGDHGLIDLAFSGSGPLRDGFSGKLAATAPGLSVGDCRGEQANLSGVVRVANEHPVFVGPLRFAQLSCASGMRVAGGSTQIDATADPDLSGVRARLGVESGEITMGGAHANGLNGTAEGVWREGTLTARYNLIARGPTSPTVLAATLAASGTVRSHNGVGHLEIEGAVDAGGVKAGRGLAGQLAHGEQVASGSLVAPLLRQVRERLEAETRRSRFTADFLLRRTDAGTSIVVPQGRFIGGSGATLLALSRVHYVSGSGAPRLAGNFFTGGLGLPQISGRMDRGAGGGTRVTMSMEDYRVGDSRLAVPHFAVAQRGDGALAFSGLAVASGPLPGGRATNLAVPLEGARAPNGALALWRGCTAVRFDALTYSGLTLDRNDLRLCPGAAGAIVRSDAAGVRIALGTPSLNLAGHVGETPIHIASGAVGYAAPGRLFAKALDVTLGAEAGASRIRLTDLQATVGSTVVGTFAGADARLGAVPFDLVGANGQWQLGGGGLVVSQAAFTLHDRAQVSRFEPLSAESATLTLADNRLTATASLHEPHTRREIVQVSLVHDLAAGKGRADLLVPGVVFDRMLQPSMLSRTTLGVVADVKGTVRGGGRVEWNGGKVTSSGHFATDSLDLAAAFGPARGISGEVRFSDLVNFVTPPHQRLAIASINPGIEVSSGEVLFQLKPGTVLDIERGTWPFLGGTLHLRPAEMRLGVAETRHYVLEIEGLDAARFVAQMDLANLSATGTFDGLLPLVFDENGGRIEGGVLTSRPPGGNVSYVGALTYKDLSPTANFAFDALKSLDYRQMRIDMAGAIAGEIVTRVRFDGVKQGAGAKRNFVTQRFAKLPLQFNVNVRAPFYALITSFKSMYDPAYVKDPRTIGLLDAAGHPLGASPAPQAQPAQGIQPPVSENKR